MLRKLMEKKGHNLGAHDLHAWRAIVMILNNKALPKMDGRAKEECKAALDAHSQVCTPAGLAKMVHHVKLIDTFRRPNEPSLTRIELGVHSQLEPIVIFWSRHLIR